MIDIVVLAEEMVAAWLWSGTAGFMWKVDLAKAYNSIDLRFLWNVLRRRGFPAEWVRWVKLCVTTTSFLVVVNRRPKGDGFSHKGASDKAVRLPCCFSYWPLTP